VITLAQAGEDAQALEAIHRGDFARISGRVKSELAKMHPDLGTG
jgi:hypothetical protein